MKAKVDFKIPVSIFREGKTYIAHSPVLDLSTSGKTVNVVQKRFEEIAQIFFEEIVEQGTVDEVLSGLGWQKVKQEWSPPIQVLSQLTKISVPLKN